MALTTDISVLNNDWVPNDTPQRVGEIRRGLSERPQAITEIRITRPAHQAVRSSRVKFRLTQTQLADLAGVNKETVNRYEFGENVRRDTENKIVEAIARYAKDHGGPNDQITLRDVAAEETAVSDLARHDRALKLLAKMSDEGILVAVDLLAGLARAYPREPSPARTAPPVETSVARVRKARGTR